MASSIFKKGYEVNREKAKQIERNRENLGKKLFDFFLLNDHDEAEIHFITEEPINYEVHKIQVGNKYENYVCSGENCSLCANGEKLSPQRAFLLIDRREYTYTDKKTGKEKTVKDQVKLFQQGVRVTSQLDRLSGKYGISDEEMTIVRLGKGQDTQYTFERNGKNKLTEEEISAALPEKLRDEYDGTMNSLYGIVKDQLMMRTKDYVVGEYDEDEDEEALSSADGIISADDDKEEEAPKKIFKKTSGKKLVKKAPATRLRAKDLVE